MGPLRPGTVDLWRVDLDGIPDAAAAPFPPLSAEESARAARFQRPGLARRFTAAHRALRAVLHHYLGADVVEFAFGSHGKPFLPLHPELRFNLSHSAALALIAVGGAGEVGVDCEAVDGRPGLDLAGLVEEAFSPSEKAAWERTSAAARRSAFYRVWTRKEAYLKATGTGLARPPSEVSVSLETAADAGEAWLHAPGEPGAWSLADLDLGPTHAGALVTAGHSRLRFFHPAPPSGITEAA